MLLLPNDHKLSLFVLIEKTRNQMLTDISQVVFEKKNKFSSLRFTVKLKDSFTTWTVRTMHLQLI